MSTKGLPMHGVTETVIEPAPASSVAALAAALDTPGPQRGDALRAAAADDPTHLEAWARLAEHAMTGGDAVAAYAFARTGYHRGLDQVRGAGWGGQGPVPWRFESNRGFLRSVAALRDAAEAIGEQEEATRCRDFLAELDPAHGIGAH